MAPVTESVKGRYGDQIEFKTLVSGQADYGTLKDKWKVIATPTYVFLDKDNNIIGRLVGAEKTEADFDAIFAKIGVTPVK